MNRKIFLLSLITVLSINNAQAVWYSPAVFMGKLARKYVVCTKKDAAFTAVIVAGLGCWAFSKLRDWRIERAKKAFINNEIQQVRRCASYSSTPIIEGTIWGKKWNMTIEANGKSGQGALKVINGSVAMVPVEAEQSL